MLNNNLLALVCTFVLSIIWLRVNDFAAHRGWISSQLSRKIIHIGTGPIFVLCWMLFTDSTEAPFLAALVPLAITIQFFLIGIGVIHDQASVEAMSRTGNPKEILRGPLFYGIAFVVLTVLFWYHSPIGIVALMLLCGGDGLADIMGRRFGKVKIPWNQNKSVTGTLFMFLGGFVLACFVLFVYVSYGYFPGPWTRFISPLLIISAVSMLIESLPFKDIDNFTVPLMAVVLGFLLL
jgi:phytol kinase